LAGGGDAQACGRDGLDARCVNIRQIETHAVNP
jgi:hypothetical protein